MAGVFQPPPTWALPVIVDETTGKALFNPVWLQWFVDFSSNVGAGGAGSGTVISVNTQTGVIVLSAADVGAGGLDTVNHWTALNTFDSIDTAGFYIVAGPTGGIAPKVDNISVSGTSASRWSAVYTYLLDAVGTFKWGTVNPTAIPAPAGSTTTFLRNDGTWAAPAGTGAQLNVVNHWTQEQFFDAEFRTPTFGSVAGFGIAPNVTDTYYCGHPSFRWLYFYTKNFNWDGYAIPSPAGATTTFLRNDGTWAVPAGSSAAAKFGGLRKTGGTTSLGTITSTYVALTTYTGNALSNQPGITTISASGYLQFSTAGDYMLTITFAAGFTADITNAREFRIRMYDATDAVEVTSASASFYVPANIYAMRDTVSVPFNVTAGMVSGGNTCRLEVAATTGTIAAFTPQEILYFVASLGPL